MEKNKIKELVCKRLQLLEQELGIHHTADLYNANDVNVAEVKTKRGKTMGKYELTDNYKIVKDTKVYQIRAIKDFGFIKKRGVRRVYRKRGKFIK